MPQVNILTKVDLMESFGETDFALDFYTDVMDLDRLLERLNAKRGEKFKKMNAAIVSIIEDYSLVGFLPFSISDKELLVKVIRETDKAIGYVHGDLEVKDEPLAQTVARISEQIHETEQQRKDFEEE